MSNVADKFSRLAFGGGEAGELAAHEALVAHENTLVPGASVRVYRGNTHVAGVVQERDCGGRRVVVRDSDGLDWECETRNLELVTVE